MEVPIWPTGTLMRVALGDSGLAPLPPPPLPKGLLGAEAGSWGQRTASSISPNMAENVVPYRTEQPPQALTPAVVPNHAVPSRHGACTASFADPAATGQWP